MKLYEKVVEECEKLLEQYKPRIFPVEKSKWECFEHPTLLLKSETAYELGGSEKEAVSGMAFFTGSNCISRGEIGNGMQKNIDGEEAGAGISDQILLYGPDLPEISGDIDYARLVWVTLRPEVFEAKEEAYRILRNIEYKRYHTHPKDFMMRISASNLREPVRVGRKGLEEGLSFAQVGNIMIEKYHENPEVLGVKIIFITKKDFPYEQVRKLCQEMDFLTGSMEQVFQKISMDCGSCGLKEICDQVEEMRELHFKIQD